jgi:hypothetical protein
MLHQASGHKKDGIPIVSLLIYSSHQETHGSYMLLLDHSPTPVQVRYFSLFLRLIHVRSEGSLGVYTLRRFAKAS